MKKLDYKTPKWDRELIRYEKIYKQYLKDKMGIKLKKDEPISNHRDIVVSFHTFNGISKERPYKDWYTFTLPRLCTSTARHKKLK